MKRLILFLALVILALPAAAAWDVQATTVTWEATQTTAVVQELRDAVLWKRDRAPAFFGSFLAAAWPSLGLTDNGDGTSTISITMPRTQAENWIDVLCPNGTNLEQIACADGEMKKDFRSVLDEYRNATQGPAAAPDLNDPS